MSAWAAGKAGPSAAPSASRAASSEPSPPAAAAGVKSVAKLQEATAIGSTAVPEKRSARRPPTTWLHAYPTKKAESTAAWRPRVIGGVATELGGLEGSNLFSSRKVKLSCHGPVLAGRHIH
jgi:hypothetical protein